MTGSELRPETWFDKLIWHRDGRAPAEELRAITTLPWAAGGDGLASTRTVNFDTAASYGAVFAAWRYLADHIATLPLHAYRDLGDRRQRMPSLPQLFQQPSAQGTLVDWLHRMVVSLASRGNAVGLITARDGFGFPIGLEWLSMSDVYCDDQSFARPVWYYQGREVPRDDIVHIPWFPVPGRVLGLSPLAAYASAVSRGLAADKFATDWFDGGGVPPGTFRNTSKTIDQDAASAIKARLVQSIRSRQPIVYGADWEYSPISVSINEARFIESHRLGATQIAVIYGVPPEEIGGDTGASLTYSTVEQNQLKAMTGPIRSWVTKLEAAFFKLLPERQYVKFAMDATVRPDTKTRYEVYQIARTIGLRSIDELRELEDLEPLPNGAGKDFAPLGKATDTGDASDQADRPGGQGPRPAPGAGQQSQQGRPRLVQGG
jgi:HK97 family phage portal protein